MLSAEFGDFGEGSVGVFDDVFYFIEARCPDYVADTSSDCGAEPGFKRSRSDPGLMRKLAVFSSVSRTRKAVHLTMVTPFGLLANAHSGRVQSEVTLDDLFRD